MERFPEDDRRAARCAFRNTDHKWIHSQPRQSMETTAAGFAQWLLVAQQEFNDLERILSRFADKWNRRFDRWLKRFSSYKERSEELSSHRPTTRCGSDSNGRTSPSMEPMRIAGSVLIWRTLPGRRAVDTSGAELY